MVYSPTTWNTNDVITKDKLNKIEQGVKTATLLSGTDIDADKDWNGKSINNVNKITVNKIKATSYLWTADPGLTKPRYIDNRYVESYTTSWITAKTTPAAKEGVLGTATIYYDISTPSISGMTIEGDVRLLKNDVVVPNSEYTVTNGSKFITIDVPVTTGDIFKLQIKSYIEHYWCHTNVFGIYALMTPIIDETETWS